MKQSTTLAIVLRRVNYGEADRVITFLTPEGKISAMAKGVRRAKSKMAGALEPFSESTVTLGQGKGQLQLVVSARLEKFYGNILADYERLQFGYEAIKMIDRSIEETAEHYFYDLLKRTFIYLHQTTIATGITEVWFRIQLEGLLGRMPDLTRDATGQELKADSKYVYDIYERGLVVAPAGPLGGDHIKLLRLARDHSPAVLAQIKGIGDLLIEALHFARHLG